MGADREKTAINMLMNILLFLSECVWKMTHPLQQGHHSSIPACLSVIGLNIKPLCLFGAQQNVSAAEYQTLSSTDSWHVHNIVYFPV